MQTYTLEIIDQNTDKVRHELKRDWDKETDAISWGRRFVQLATGHVYGNLKDESGKIVKKFST